MFFREPGPRPILDSAFPPFSSPYMILPKSLFLCFCIGVFLKAVDLSKPIDKRIYKGTQPTCHDFNQYSATAESVALIVGFSAGQVQYLDPIKKETSKLFNEEVPHESLRVCFSSVRESVACCVSVKPG